MENSTGRACLFPEVPEGKVLLKASVLAAALVFSCFDALSSMLGMWIHREEYSYGFLVPFISLYFIYAGRHRLKGIRISPCIPGGLLLVITGCLLLILGNAGSVILVQQGALILIVPGLALLLFGREFLRALALPLGYLVLMLPLIIDLVIDRIHWPFQLFTAATAGKLLGLLHIPVFRNAQYLILPNITLEVANACSGARYLTSVIAVGIPLACFTQKTAVQRVVLIFFSVMIGIIANPVRVTLIGIWSYYTGQDVHGPFHIFQGLFVSGVGFVFLFTGALVMAKKYPNPKEAHRGSSGGLPEAGSPGNTGKFRKAWVLAALVFFAAGCFLRLFPPLPVPLPQSLREAPLTIGEWKGVDVVSSALPLDADQEINRVYHNNAGREIRLQIGYIEAQRQGKKLIPHRLQKLYDGAEGMELPLGPHTSAAVNKISFYSGAPGSFAIYWHSQDGRITAGRFETKLVTALRGLFQRRTNGATVIISGGVDSPGADDGAAFAREIIPALRALHL